MSGWTAMRDFLATDPRDVGCGEALRVLHVAVEMHAAGLDTEHRLPGVALHLAACGPCGEDFDGLLALFLDHGADGPPPEGPHRSP